MANSQESASFEMDSAIPTGSWTLYFHYPEETKWTLNTFISLGSMNTWGDFWSLIEVLKSETFSDGMFFIMKDPIPPLWEDHRSIRGGCYSFRAQKKDAPDVYMNYIIATMLNGLTSDSKNVINGLSICQKRGFNIIKVWNRDAQQFNNGSDLVCGIHPSIRETDIIYTPFVQKKL
jgi:hypothetical protein